MRGERGGVTILVAAAMVVAVGLLGAVGALSQVLLCWERAQNAADAAALAGAGCTTAEILVDGAGRVFGQRLVVDESSALTAAQEVAALNLGEAAGTSGIVKALGVVPDGRCSAAVRAEAVRLLVPGSDATDVRVERASEAEYIVWGWRE